MFGADVVVEQRVRFFGGELQHALGLGAERNFDGGGHLLAKDRPAFDFLADVFERKMRAREDAAGQALAFPNQPKEKMLGLNRNAAELAGLIAREEKDSSGSLGIPFEHPACLGESRQ